MKTTIDPRDLQVTHARSSEREAKALAAAVTDAGVPCDVHQFPEYQGNWWAVCAQRRSQLERGRRLVTVYSAGARDALDLHYCRPLERELAAAYSEQGGLEVCKPGCTNPACTGCAFVGRATCDRGLAF